jgi:hypothetical protein
MFPGLSANSDYLSLLLDRYSQELATLLAQGSILKMHYEAELER